MTFDFDSIKDWVVCPKSKAQLILHGDALLSCDPETRLSYPIRDDIPILLVDDATAVDQEEWTNAMQAAGRDAAGKLATD